MRRALILCLLAAAALAGCPGPVVAENWPQWRGPRMDGSSPEADLPANLDVSTNLAWKVDLPGGGAGTPVVWGDRVFISAQDDQSNTHALCFSATDGRELWRREVGKGFRNRQQNTAASPSAVTDGERVVFFFGSGDMTAYAPVGAQLWKRNLESDYGKFEMMWDFASSPLLLDGRVYLAVIHGSHRSAEPDKSYLVCIDAATGQTVWKVDRHTDAAFESKQAYTTVIPLTVNGRTSLMVLGGDYLSTHDPVTGKEIWRSPSVNPGKIRAGRIVPSPVVSGGMILVCAPRGGTIYAIRPGATDWAWTKRGKFPDVPTPLGLDGRAFVLHGGRRVLTCLEPETGEILGEATLEGRGPMQASPTGADGKIYCLSMRGEVFVCSAEDQPVVLDSAELGGSHCRSSVAIAGGRLFVRTDDRLFCFAKRE